VPWSPDAWRGLANSVFIPGKADEKKSEGVRFRIAYNLIMGSEKERPDQVLTQDLHSSPDATNKQTITGNGEKK
jgi:hypothetical protein